MEFWFEFRVEVPARTPPGERLEPAPSRRVGRQPAKLRRDGQPVRLLEAAAVGDGNDRDRAVNRRPASPFSETRWSPSPAPSSRPTGWCHSPTPASRRIPNDPATPLSPPE